ncbi:MAG: MFS transporter [Oscillospiraceae bacterium]|jgi:Na+/melibiose symporter-like transporter|nr:MFS transporter [Oscillospiraceae bacterium]
MGIWSDIQTALNKRLKPSSQKELDMFLNHPVTWFKGDYLDDGVVHPWEKLLWSLHGFFSTATGSFNGQDRLFRYTYHVDPRHITISSAIQNTWDFINDPLIGAWMDHHPFQDKTYRNIIRFNHILSVLMNIIVLLNLGLTPFQHILVWSARNMIGDILGTFAGISSTKYFAGLTPYSNERGKINVWKNVGTQMSYPIANIPGWIFGLVSERARQTTFTDYRVFVIGSLIVLPLALVGGLIQTYCRNRVQFHPIIEAEGAQGKAVVEEKPSLREAFIALRYNKYLLLNAGASIITMFTPSSDDYPIWRFLVPGLRFGKNADGSDRIIRGEALNMIKGQVSGIPITFLYPFLRQMTGWLGGPRRAHLWNSVANMASGLVRYFVGYKSWPAIAVYFLCETATQTLGAVDGYAGEILNYEMLDYVEYKTGLRSEGVTAAFNGLREKIISKNLDSFTKNEFLRWSGIGNVDFNDPNAKLPARYTKWAWALFTLAPVIDSVIWFAARMLFKYDPKQKDLVEAELQERRALAQEKAAELAVQTRG